MKKEPSDKLAGLEGHSLLTVRVSIIPPEEGNLAFSDGEDAVITDRDPVGISAEVLKDAPGAIKGRLALDDPLLMVELSPEGFEVAGMREMTDPALNTRLPDSKQCLRRSRNLPRNNADMTLTGRKNPWRQDIQRLRSEDRPPPVTIQWRWG